MGEINLINRGELQTRLVKGLDILGERAPAPVLDPEVQAVVLLEDLTRVSVFRQVLERSYSSIADIAAVAGQVGEIALFNPVGSGVIIRVDSCRIGCPTANVFNIGRADPASLPTGTLVEVAHDQRGPRSTGVVTGGTTATLDLLSFFSMERVLANTTKDAFPTFGRPVILQEGEGFGIQAQIANLIAQLAVTWTEFDD